MIIKKKVLLNQPVNRIQNDPQNNAIQLRGTHCVLYNNIMAFTHKVLRVCHNNILNERILIAYSELPSMDGFFPQDYSPL